MYKLPYYFTQGEKKELIKSLVYIIDTREKENKHIIEYFDTKKLPHKVRALPAGDYSVMLPQNEELGIMRDIYLNSSAELGIMIERKNSLEELAGNLGKNRDRFESELERMGKAEKHLVVEKGDWGKIRKGMYQSELGSKAYYESLLTFQSRYNLHIHFPESREESAALIHAILRRKVCELISN